VSEEKQAAGTLIDTVLEGMYRVDSLIGEGGMGAVYAATQLRLDKRVAVKVEAIMHSRGFSDALSAIDVPT